MRLRSTDYEPSPSGLAMESRIQRPIGISFAAIILFSVSIMALIMSHKQQALRLNDQILNYHQATISETQAAKELLLNLSTHAESESSTDSETLAYQIEKHVRKVEALQGRYQGAPFSGPVQRLVQTLSDLGTGPENPDNPTQHDLQNRQKFTVHLIQLERLHKITMNELFEEQEQRRPTELRLLLGLTLLYLLFSIALVRWLFGLVIEAIRKRGVAESKAQKDMALANEVLESSIEGIVVTDEKSVILQANPAFCKASGYEKEFLIGRKINLLRSDRHEPSFFEEMWHKLQTDGQWEGEIWNRKRDGVHYPQWVSISTLKHQDGEARYVAVYLDLSELKRKDEELRYLAMHDPLTGLPNRRLFKDRLNESMKRARRNKEAMALLFLDLDNFKVVNDSLGHSYGDELLVKVGTLIRSGLREKDTLSRFGGDEFTVILEDLHVLTDVVVVAAKLLKILADPVHLGGEEVFVGVSIGIALYPMDGGDAETLLKNADAAMYQAKANGRNQYQMYSLNMNRDMKRHFQLANQLRKALENEEFHLVYQPKVRMSDKTVQGVETLLRWTQPDGKAVSPGEFIPVAESCGMILVIGEWVLRRACAQMKAWHDAGYKHLTLAVNLSSVQLRLEHPEQMVTDILLETGLDPQALELEITESAVMEDLGKAISFMKNLGEIGVQFAIDDFGTGYSSLVSLKKFPIHTLKIDRAFVMDMTAEGDAIIDIIISMARLLNLEVVAEGVENQQQFDLLKKKGCELMQGYYFSPGKSADDFLKLIEETCSIE